MCLRLSGQLCAGTTGALLDAVVARIGAAMPPVAAVVLDLSDTPDVDDGARAALLSLCGLLAQSHTRLRLVLPEAETRAALGSDEAASTAGLKPVTAERRDLFKNPLLAAELDRFDAVVFDPPRQGADAQSRALAASGVPLVVAVSCNPGTLARDIRHLIDGGYRLTSVTPVDQFRYSEHVEIVARLEK